MHLLLSVRAVCRVLFVGVLVLAGLGRAGAAGPDNASIVLEAGGGRVFHTGRPIANLFVGDPKVAEARPASPTSVFVLGLAPGRTTVAALDESGAVLSQFDVSVRPSNFPAQETRRGVPDLTASDTLGFNAIPNGVGVSGTVRDAADAERVDTAARLRAGSGGFVDNRTVVASSDQVMLKVRVAEISRNITRQLGINWNFNAVVGAGSTLSGALTDGLSAATNLPNTLSSTINGSSFNTILDLLAQDQLITMLAEPTLTARSGEVASFLAGGEFPIPVSQSNGTISIVYKPYGVSLSFVPTVLGPGRISLHVRPEVSELSPQTGITLTTGSSLFSNSTLTVPGITVRRGDTTVELGSGQSFSIAGLLTRNNAFNARGLPVLGDLPVLGPLFRSDLYQRGESELVIVVTPYLVRPVSEPSRIRAPTDGFVPAADVDRVLLSRQRALPAGQNPIQFRSSSQPASRAFQLHGDPTP